MTQTAVGCLQQDGARSHVRFAWSHKIEEAAERGELNELVLLVIWTRLDLARRDEEKDAIRSLDLLYRRIETEILKRQASPAMRLLNELLIMHDGFDDEGWLKACKKRMIETFPREDPFSLLVPAGFDLDKVPPKISHIDLLRWQDERISNGSKKAWFKTDYIWS
ncbi:putative protein PALE CRESS [Helianthus annuus]|nr:putative protein PALE CRESS [Helianthus annuus]